MYIVLTKPSFWYRIHLVAENNKTVFTSESYLNKTNALRSARKLRANTGWHIIDKINGLHSTAIQEGVK